MTTTERLGPMGDTYEYSIQGKRMAGTDRQTKDELIAHSAKWPNSYHAHVAVDTGHWTWAYRGHEIAESDLPRILRRD